MPTGFRLRLSRRAIAHVLITGVAFACGTTHAASPTPTDANGAASSASEAAIRTQLDRYRTAVISMNYDTIASVFTANASLSHEQQSPITSRDSIRKFLMSFSAYHVTAYELVADSQTVSGADGRAVGHYAQTVRIPDGTIVTVTGTFTTQWRREADGIWRIIVLHTASPPHT